MRNPIETFFHTKVRDQYASSEGAPFIYECPEGNMHMDLRSGVFEVLDNNGNPCEKGNLVVTSFSTKGTPLIRYKIGDTVKLTRKTCTCGNNNPLVDYISGRINDFIFSPENGKINLGNVSNCLKGVHGIIKFQVIQEVEEEITVLAIKDESIFTLKDEEVFLNNFIERMGKFIKIDLKYVKEIPNEKSGKFRIVKNSLEIH